MTSFTVASVYVEYFSFIILGVIGRKGMESGCGYLRILVLGADGLIGSKILNDFREMGFEVLGTSRRSNFPKGRFYFDLTENLGLEDIPAADWVYLFAGFTNVNFCNSHKALSHLVNVKRMKELIKIYCNRGSKVIFPSSNLVFSGEKAFYKKSDVVNPQSHYAEQKVMVEEFILENFPQEARIVRMTKVVHAGAPFISRWLQEYGEGRPVPVAVNRLLSPIDLEKLSKAFKELPEDWGKETIIHFSGRSEVAYSEFASMWFCKYDLNESQLLFVEEETGLPDKKIHNSLLSDRQDLDFVLD